MLPLTAFYAKATRKVSRIWLPSVSGNTCVALLQFQYQFRDRLIGRTSAFGAEYPGSSPGPGTNLFRRLHQRTFASLLHFPLRCKKKQLSITFSYARIRPLSHNQRATIQGPPPGGMRIARMDPSTCSSDRMAIPQPSSGASLTRKGALTNAPVPYSLQGNYPGWLSGRLGDARNPVCERRSLSVFQRAFDGV